MGLHGTLDWREKYGADKLFIPIRPDDSSFTGKWQDQPGTRTNYGMAFAAEQTEPHSTRPMASAI